MAGDNAFDGDKDPLALDDSTIDGAVDDLRGVLKKNAGEEPVFTEESLNNMSGAPAFGSEFGDFTAAESDPLGTDAATDFGTEPLGGDFSGVGGLNTPGMGGGDSFAGTAMPGSNFDAKKASPTIGASGTKSRVDLVMDIPIDVKVILGSSRMAVSSLLELSDGATIALDRKIGEPVEIMVNGKLIGRGEIAVLDLDEARFAVKIIEVIGEQKKKTG